MSHAPVVKRSRLVARSVTRSLLSLLGAAIVTLALFMVLPLMESISKPPDPDTLVQGTDAIAPPPPPPVQEEEEEEPPKEEEKPPELTEVAPPLDLSQLELSLNVSGGDGGPGDFVVKLPTSFASAGGGDDALFSVSDLDQKPRAIYQPSPVLTNALRNAVKNAPVTVYILFIVDQNGRVQNPIIQNPSNPEFEKAALSAVKNWKFEPGKRSGQAVRFRMRVPITFQKGQ
jgi:protein TonB